MRHFSCPAVFGSIYTTTRQMFYITVLLRSRYEMTLVGIAAAVLEVGALLLRWLWRGCYCCCRERPAVRGAPQGKVKSL
jgi:hypothetical protein